MPFYHPRLKSLHAGLTETIRAIFLMRSQPLIRFSRSIALRISSKRSKYTRRSTLKFRGKTGASPHFVLAHSPDEIVCHVRIKRLGPVSHDVDEVDSRLTHPLPLCVDDCRIVASLSVTSEHICRRN